MSIDRINRQSFINAYNSNSNKCVKNVAKSNTFDTIEISSLGKSLKNYFSENNIDNARKVAEIKSKVESGTYSIDARMTARSMLDAMKGE
ncbi:flagellar biosynthesis anti-sigma factor FlgM [Clostridium butyricum]|uniref:flagellar biosynthesis anti-sigma factor FlgM n=1 Tax=Clostridium butyricum TaxID=1492 RepID=UPI0013D17B97|nr:flagellar biosynthesis anti-sigma factor FlgM [Clostridium butyricum]MCQ2022265.1 flagellar biosynthesis anti-sigma factor FlgM [Clostridium butyricum]NFB70130.1 flagellar biosynthesis anti-sigma factor FlgM [Clostridium butyricum]NFB89917.1 flagellar biosynthesis anti-sigma factor FlgM [Clostridium butyricum]